MFDRLAVPAKDPPSGRRAAGLISLAAHAVVLGGAALFSLWSVDRLQPPRAVPVFFHVAAPPPPPPPAPAPTPPTARRDPLRAARALPPLAQPAETPAETPADPARDATGAPSDVGLDGLGLGGPAGGTGAGVAPAPPPAPPPPPRLASVRTMEAHRIAGDPRIQLPAQTKQRMANRGLTSTIAQVRLCLDARGVPASVELTRGTGFPEADARIVGEIRGWRYRPYVVGGAAVPICTVIVLRYHLEIQD